MFDMNEYREVHKTQIAKRKKLYRLKHLKRDKRNAKRYRREHKEQIASRKKKYYQTHKTKKRIYNKNYYPIHKARKIFLQKKLRNKNKTMALYMYGDCVCAECGENRRKKLLLHHIFWNGREHRFKLLGKNRGGWIFYACLKKHKFPNDLKYPLQVLCVSCHTRKHNKLQKKEKLNSPGIVQRRGESRGGNRRKP